MNHHDHSELQRLIQLADAAPSKANEDSTAPLGFATRVVSNAWSSSEAASRSVLTTLRWGLALASVLMISSVLINLNSLKEEQASPHSMISQHVTELVLNP